MGQYLRLEPAGLAGGCGVAVLGPAADHMAHHRIEAQSFGVVHIFVARRRFDDQGEPYLTEPTAEYRKHWYRPSNLGKLAAELDYDSECGMFQEDLSASVHASPWSLINGPAIKPEFVLTWAMALGLRAAGAIADAYRIPLDEDQQDVIATAKRNMYDKPKPPSEEASRESEVKP